MEDSLHWERDPGVIKDQAEAVNPFLLPNLILFKAGYFEGCMERGPIAFIRFSEGPRNRKLPRVTEKRNDGGEGK
jgi:hypothetical protein